MNVRMVFFILFFAIIVSSCTKEVSDIVISDGSFQVLALTVGAYNDQSSNQRCYEALQSLSRKLKVNIYFKSVMFPYEINDLMNVLNEKEYDFILGLDSQLYNALCKSAIENPYQKYAILGSSPGNNKNLGTITYQPSHHYLAGVVAGLKSKNGKIGMFSRHECPQSTEDINAFNDGARAVNSDIVITNVTFDSSHSKKIVANYADVFRKSGVDVLFNNCGILGLELYKWAETNKIQMIGSIDDQYRLAPSVVLTSIQKNYEKMLGFALEQMMRGQWQGSLYRFGMAEKVTDIAPLRGVLDTSQEEVFYELYKEIAIQKGEVFE